jgi:hypothetical protein
MSVEDEYDLIRPKCIGPSATVAWSQQSRNDRFLLSVVIEARGKLV